MDLIEAISQRKSTRAFLPNPVSRDILEKILQTALWSPSWANTQPWEFLVAGGEVLKMLSAELRIRLNQQVESCPDFPMPTEWPEPYKTRITDLGKNLFETVGISRDDAKSRHAHYERMYGLFDAPAAVFILTGEALGCYSLFDCGSVTQSLCLAAEEFGLGTCIMAAPVRHPDIIRTHMNVPPGRKFVIAVAIGYPDPDSLFNKFRSPRVPLSELVTWQDI